jgi:hypothetical protein
MNRIKKPQLHEATAALSPLGLLSSMLPAMTDVMIVVMMSVIVMVSVSVMITG